MTHNEIITDLERLFVYSCNLATTGTAWIDANKVITDSGPKWASAAAALGKVLLELGGDK